MGVVEEFKKKAEKFRKEGLKNVFNRLKFWGKKEGQVKRDAATGMPVYEQGGRGTMPQVEEGEGGRLKIRRPSGGIIKLIVLVIIGIGVVVFFTQNALVNSLLGGLLGQIQPVWNQQIGGVPLSDAGEYVNCVLENSWVYRLGGVITNPAAITGDSPGGDLFEFCKQELVAAQDIGCTECFTVSAEALNLKIQAGSGQEAIVSSQVRAELDEFCYNDLLGEQACQPLTPAASPSLEIVTEDGVKAEIETNFELGEELNPAILVSTPLTAVGRFNVDNLCGSQTKALNAEAVLTYTYRTEGSAPINIRKQVSQEPFAFQRNSIALPGPVKVDIIPDSYSAGGVYTSDLFTTSFVFVKFRNAGQGEAVVRNLELKQISPEGVSPLPLKKCSGPIKGDYKEDGRGGVSITTESELSPSDRSSTITCSFDMTGTKDLKSDFTTFIIIGTATYEYQLKSKASSILVDTTCEQPAGGETPTEGAIPTSGDGGVTQVEVVK